MPRPVTVHEARKKPTGAAVTDQVLSPPVYVRGENPLLSRAPIKRDCHL